MVDFAPTSLFKQQEEVYKLVYAPAILPRGARVDGAHSGANRGRRTTNDAEKMVPYIFSSNVNLIQLLRYNSIPYAATGVHPRWHADSGQPCTNLSQAAHSK